MHCGNTHNTSTRRDFLQRAGGGFGALALSHLLGSGAGAAQVPHFAGKAKSVGQIHVISNGGPLWEALPDRWPNP